MIRTGLCDGPGIDVPVIQAPFGRWPPLERAAAVSNAGSLAPFTAQSVGLVHEVLSAAEVLGRLVAEAEEALRYWRAPAQPAHLRRRPWAPSSSGAG